MVVKNHLKVVEVHSRNGSKLQEFSKGCRSEYKFIKGCEIKQNVIEGAVMLQKVIKVPRWVY